MGSLPPLYHLPELRALDAPLQIDYLDPEEIMEGDTTPDRHSFYALLLFIEGAGVHHIDFLPYPVKPNTLYLLAPGQVHYFENMQPPLGYRIFFDEQFVSLTLGALVTQLFDVARTHPALQLNSAELSVIHPFIQRMLQEFKRDGMLANSAMSNLLHLLLIEICRCFDERGIVLDQQQNELSNRFVALVRQHLTDNHRTKFYADCLSVTPDYLTQRVKAALGIPPSKYIQRQLLLEAKRLLLFTDMTALEISDVLGFSDDAYFSRVFKRQTDKTPVQFRNANREKYNFVPQRPS